MPTQQGVKNVNFPKCITKRIQCNYFLVQEFFGGSKYTNQNTYMIFNIGLFFKCFYKKSINQVQQWFQDFELTFIDSADNKSTKGEMAPRLRTIFRPSGWKHILCNAPAAFAWSFSSFDEINSTYIIRCFLHTWEMINNTIEPWITMV
jgi:hypothetical protein